MIIPNIQNITKVLSHPQLKRIVKQTKTIEYASVQDINNHYIVNKINVWPKLDFLCRPIYGLKYTKTQLSLQLCLRVQDILVMNHSIGCLDSLHILISDD